MIAGAGDFGAEMATQISRIRNMETCVLCDLDVEKAKSVFIEAGCREDDIAFADTAEKAAALIQKGKRVVSDNAVEMARADGIEVVCDATGEPYFGAELAHGAILARKHVVVVNIESDVGTGFIMSKLARENGVVYTGADGDQPSLINGLVNWSRCLGFGIVAAGKWTSLHPEEMWFNSAKRTDSGYADGSKNQVEMCCVANMTGLVPDTRGLRKPSLQLDEIADVFALKSDGGIFSQNGVIDVVNCLSADGKTRLEHRLGGGVFVVAECDAPRFAGMLASKSVQRSRDGKRAFLYRPYHLVGIEAPMSIMRAALCNEATGAPLERQVAEVIAISKRDLKKGERLDGIGGKTVRGEIELASVSASERSLPLCMAEDVVVKQDVPRNTPLSLDMLEKDGESFLWHLRKNNGLHCAGTGSN